MRARDNPFRNGRVLQIRYRWQHASWAELLARCAALRYRAALIGPHGSGKTTLLEDLELRLRADGFGTRFIRLDEAHRSFDRSMLQTLFASLTSRDIILFDGAEQMNSIAWLWFRWRARHASGLIITSHRPGCRLSGNVALRPHCSAKSPPIYWKAASALSRTVSVRSTKNIMAPFAPHCANATIWPRPAP